MFAKLKQYIFNWNSKLVSKTGIANRQQKYLMMLKMTMGCFHADAHIFEYVVQVEHRDCVRQVTKRDLRA